jgi:hypothetical protein
VPRPLEDECVTPEVVKQLDGAAPEGTRDVQRRQYDVLLVNLARMEHQIADIVAHGDGKDCVNQLHRELQGRVLDCP